MTYDLEQIALDNDFDVICYVIFSTDFVITARDSVRRLVHAFVTSILDYCKGLLSGVRGVHLDELQRVQKAAARLIFSVRRRESITPYLRCLHWLPVRRRISYKVASLVHYCLHGLTPRFLPCLISLPRRNRQLRLTSTNTLNAPHTRTTSFGDRAFSVSA